MPEDAIKNDVSAETAPASQQNSTPAEQKATPVEQETKTAGEGDQTTSKRSPFDRADMINQIARQAEADRHIQRDEEPPAPEQKVSTKDEPTDDERTAPISVDSLGIYLNQKGQAVMMLKIEGREREMTVEQVKAVAQKNLAADQRLQQASESQRQLSDRENKLREREKALDAREAKLKSSESQPPKQPPAMDAAAAKKKAEAFLDKLYNGEDGEAVEMVADLFMRPQATLSEEDLSEHIAAVLNKRETENFQKQWDESAKEGNRIFRDEYPELAGDPEAKAAVNGLTADMLRRRDAGDPDFSNLMPKDIIIRAAKAVQKMTKREVDDQDGEPITSREALKEQLKPIPSRSSAKPTVKAEPEVDLSPAAVIQRMRSSRAVI